MSKWLLTILTAVLIASVLGVAFSVTYPGTEIHGGLVLLFVVVGLVIALSLAAIFGRRNSK